jgi:hypothetical protein
MDRNFDVKLGTPPEFWLLEAVGPDLYCECACHVQHLA